MDLLLLVPEYNRSKFNHTTRRGKLIRKGLCIGLPLLIVTMGAVLSVLFEGFGVWEAVPAYYLLPLGMLICAIGDIVIEIRFTRGGMLFGVGHLVYITAAMLLLQEVHATSIVCFLILAIFGAVLTVKYLTKKHRVLMLIYNTVISASFAMGLGMILQGTPGEGLVGFGFMFLVISDWLLARNRTFKTSPTWSLVSLLFYFGGQIMISTFPFLG